MVFDLGLHRVPQKEFASLLEEALYKTLKAQTINPTKTLDEKRALLGYFVLSSKYVVSRFTDITVVIFELIRRSVSMCFRRSESLRYTPYFEECRQSLAKSDDHPNDVLAAAMVKLQNILEKIYHSPWNMKDNSGGSLPVVFLVNSIEEQLKQFQEEFSVQMENQS